MEQVVALIVVPVAPLRLFAAAREAAGPSRAAVDEAPVGLRPHGGVTLRDGSVVEVLPPFAGG